MTITINELTNGMVLLIDGELYLVQEYHHVKPGKGSAFARVKLKSYKTDNVIERTFRSAERMEDAFIEDRSLEFLYTSGPSYHFMDHSSYEEVTLEQAEIGEGAKFLLENLEVTGLYYNHKILKVILPNFITAKIIETEPGIRGDSSRSGTKPAKIAAGATILVPLFINVDDWIKIDTRTGVYVERVLR
jgi:elongation factor P